MKTIEDFWKEFEVSSFNAVLNYSIALEEEINFQIHNLVNNIAKS